MTYDCGQPVQTIASIGIDIGKDVFHIVGFDAAGKVALRKKFKRLALEAELAKLPPSVIGLEACLSAHFGSRTLLRLGHTPRIIPAIYVKPFTKGQKNDTTMPRPSPRRPCGPTCASCRRRRRISWTCRRCIASARASSHAARRRSTRSAPSSSSTGSPSARAPTLYAGRSSPFGEPRRRAVAAHERPHRRALRGLAVARRAYRDAHQ
jgi:hypothetical protein